MLFKISADPYKEERELRPSRPRSSESQKAFDVFRPPGFQMPIRSGDSTQHLINDVHEGVYVGNHPLPLEVRNL